MTPTQFEWDERKNQMNIRKHGISFEQVKPLFIKGDYEVEFDAANSTLSEDRFIAAGFVENLGGVIVVFCEKVDDVIRIISARRAR